MPDNAVHRGVLAVRVDHECAGGVAGFPVSFKFMVESAYTTV